MERALFQIAAGAEDAYADYLRTLTQFWMENALRRADIPPSFVAPFCRDQGITLLILFGSCAMGDMTADSDVDLGFLRERDLTGIIPWEELVPARRVDAHNLQDAPIGLRYEIVHTGLVAYAAKPGLFLEFREKAQRELEETIGKRSLEQEEDRGIPLSEYLLRRARRRV